MLTVILPSRDDRKAVFYFDLCFSSRLASVSHEFPFSTDFILLPFSTPAQAASSLAASVSWLGQAHRVPFPAEAYGEHSREPGDYPSPLLWADKISHQEEPVVDSLVVSSPPPKKSWLLCHMLYAVLPLQKIDTHY